MNVQNSNAGAQKGHGGKVERGLNSTVRSRLYQGRFGRMFRTLPSAEFTEEALTALAHAMIAPKETDVTAETDVDDEENYGLPAGYTYLGQFVDHDITFDPMSSLMKQNDPDGLVDFRTPALDLDCLYGRGPDDQPYMYTPDGMSFLFGERQITGIDKNIHAFSHHDLPRFQGRALIGDKRNDENVIVSQLQGLFLRFHNFMVKNHPGESFEQVQRRVRWHYQWLVLFDYLPRIVGRSMVHSILPHLDHLDEPGAIYEHQPNLSFFKFQDYPFMPVEFSAAAYRFGHSMVRPVYRLSQKDLVAHGQTAKNLHGLNGRKQIFSPDHNDGLNGFAEFEQDFGIDWRLFFEVDSVLAPANQGKGRVQPAYKIDTSLVNPLSTLPEFSIPNTDTEINDQEKINNLALRNLRRGAVLGLPSGQAVARAMGIKPLTDAELIIGKATADVENKKDAENVAISITELSQEKNLGKVLEGNAPLWFYILAEARHVWAEKAAVLQDDEMNAVPTILGPVGGRIVAETLIGLLLGDPQSFLNIDPNWKPLPSISNADEDVFEIFTMADLVRHVP